MLAEAFQENFWEFYNGTLLSQPHAFNFPENINLFNLYRKFINTKYEIYFKYKIQSPRIKTHEAILIQNFTKLVKLAFKLLIPTEINFLTRCELTPDYEDILRTIGIVQSQNIKLNFVHRTFAEYFVADQISYFIQKDQNNPKYIKTIKFLKDVFFKDEWNVVIKFCDRIFTESHPILNAILNNDEKFFENDKLDIKVLDVLGRNAAHLINLLMKKTIDVTICDSIFGWTPIVYAVQHHNWNIAELLLKAGAHPTEIRKVKNVKTVDENGMTLLHFASMHTNDDIVKRLLERGVDVNVPDIKGLTPLFYAIKADNMAVIKLLCNEKAYLSCVNEEGLNPITYAKKYKKYDVLQYFYETWQNIINIDKIINELPKEHNYSLREL